MAAIKKWFPVLIILMTVLLVWVFLQMQKRNEVPVPNPMQIQIEQLTATQIEQTKRIDSLQSQMGDSAQAWVLSEVYYYLNIAHLRLSVFNDVKTALQLMQWSQQRLTMTHAPIGLQEALLSDISELNTVEIPQITNITESLSAVASQLPQLTLLRTTQTEDVTTMSATPALSNWKQALKDAWHEVKHLVRIQPRTANMDYVLFDETILRQTVHVELERASIAAIVGQSDLYQASLQQAIAALQQFFAPTPELQQAVEMLEYLLTQPIVPQIPTANRALIWLQMQSGQGSV